MNKIILQIFITALLLIFCRAETVYAQSGGLQLLGIGAEPTSLALSETVTARGNGSASIFSNPANLAFEKRASVTASHTFWIQNSGNSHASVNLPGLRGTFAFGVLTSSIGDIQAYSEPGMPTGSFDVNYYSFAGSYALKVGPVSAGISMMYLYEQLYQLSASGYGINAGLSARFLDDRVRIGSALLNAGRMELLAVTRSPLPTQWKSGVWSDLVQFSVSGSNQIPVLISLGADLTIPLNEDGASDGATNIRDPWLSTGIEVTISEMLILRTGIRTGETKRRFSTGIGVNFDSVQFNYAFIPFETGFGLTHALSLVYYFDI
jgi:hypothetical protein